jgi:hypothetical protein
MNDEIRINMAGCKLGYFHPIISPTGFNAGRCQNWGKWYPISHRWKRAKPLIVFPNADASFADLLEHISLALALCLSLLSQSGG